MHKRIQTYLDRKAEHEGQVVGLPRGDTHHVSGHELRLTIRPAGLEARETEVLHHLGAVRGDPAAELARGRGVKK